ncbi:hypothetical protein [Streptomyces sp. NPDC002054]|uniref:hypothetical protein n=1 Tax=Streptomyces sp. NPDC002054 TaxID=3154663 RepID=UPI003328CB5D
MSTAETYRQINAWVGAIEIPLCATVFATFAAEKLICRITPWNNGLFLRATASVGTKKTHAKASLLAMRAAMDLGTFCGTQGIRHSDLKAHLLRAREIRLAILWSAIYAATGAITIGGIATRASVHNYPKIPEWAPSSSYLVGMALSIYMTRKFYIRWIHEAYFTTVTERLITTITMCVDTYQGTVHPLVLNQRMDGLRLTLAHAVNIGFPGISLERANEIRDHIRDVIHTVHLAMGDVLARGNDELRPLAQILGTVLQRVMHGRWQGLLDDHQITTYEEKVQEQPSRLRTWRDPILLIVGVILLAAASTGAQWVGLGSDVMPIISGAVLLLPLALWGSRRAGISPNTIFSTIRSGAGVPESPTAEQGPRPHRGDPL